MSAIEFYMGEGYDLLSSSAEGNARVQALIISLREQEDLLFEAFALFEFTVPSPE